jgi:hypothetical protein
MELLDALTEWRDGVMAIGIAITPLESNRAITLRLTKPLKGRACSWVAVENGQFFRQLRDLFHSADHTLKVLPE